MLACSGASRTTLLARRTRSSVDPRAPAALPSGTSSLSIRWVPRARSSSESRSLSSVAIIATSSSASSYPSTTTQSTRSAPSSLMARQRLSPSTIL